MLSLQRRILLFVCVMLLSVTSYGQGSSYNVLFIAVDDLNDYLGFMGGNSQAITPNFDRLASESVIFTNAQCPAPKCAPSRNALLSGVYPHEHYIPVPMHFRDVPGLEDRIALPQHFNDNGYKTMSVGKVFHQWGGAGADYPYSWDVLKTLEGDFTGHLNSGEDALPIDSSMLFNNACLNAQDYTIPAVGPIYVATADYVETKSAEWVGTRLQNYYANPFFLSIGFFKPHIPYYAPKEWFDLYEDSTLVIPDYLENDLDDIPPIGDLYLQGNRFNKLKECDVLDELMLGYLANVSYVDYCLGIVLDQLETSPHKDNTIVVLWSDHGHHLGEKNHLSKNTLYEESTKVPLLIKVPGLTKAGQIEESPVNLMDLYPTLIELCGLPELDSIGGRTLVPLLDDSRNTFDYPSITTLDTIHHSIRTKQFRYIRYGDGSEELYNHDTDENEWNNLAAASNFNQIKNKLSDQLDNILMGGNGLMNEAPRVKWTKPLKGNSFLIDNNSGFAHVPIKIDAYDIDGEVVEAELWVNGELKKVFQAPYEMIWETSEIGYKLLRILVRDDEGETIWSKANYIAIDVNASLLSLFNNEIFTIQPNPISQDFFEINFKKNDDKEIEVLMYSMEGLLIQKWDTTSTKNKLKIKDIHNGIYFIRIFNDEGISEARKVVLLK